MWYFLSFCAGVALCAGFFLILWIIKAEKIEDERWDK